MFGEFYFLPDLSLYVLNPFSLPQRLLGREKGRSVNNVKIQYFELISLDSYRIIV